MNARARQGALLVVAALALPAAGCGNAPTPRTFTVGGHRVSTVTPRGWEVLDHGQEILIRRGDEQIAIRDLGPIGPVGIRHEVERAREQWRAGQDRVARWRLRRVSVPDELFLTAAQREEFSSQWSEVSHARADTRFDEVEPAFAALLARVAALPAQDLDSLVDHTLDQMDRPGRRGVASRRRVEIGGRQVVIVDTWDRLTHGQRQRIAFVLNDGYLLALHTDRGRFEVTAETFDVMVAALRIG